MASTSLGSILVKVAADITSFTAAMSKVKTDLDGVAKSASGLDKLNTAGKTLSAGVTAPLVGAGLACVALAADVNKTEAQMGRTFGVMAEGAKKWASSFADSTNNTTGDVEKVMAKFQLMATGMGMSTEEAAKLSEKMTKLTYDVSAYAGIDVESAQAAVSQGLQGRGRGLKQYGFNIDGSVLDEEAASKGDPAAKAAATQAKVDADAAENEVLRLEAAGASADKIAAAKEKAQQAAAKAKLAANMAGDDASGADLSPAEKLAAYGSAMSEQGGRMDGTSLVTAKGMAGQLRGIYAEIDEIMVSFGKEILPPLTQVIAAVASVLKPLISGFGALPGPAKQTIIVIAGLAAIIGPLLLVIGFIIPAVTAVIGILPALGVVFAVLTGPIALVILAIIALVAIGYYLYTNWDAISKTLGQLWQGLCDYAGGIWKGISDAISGAVNAVISFISGLWSRYVNLQITIWKGIFTAAGQVWKTISDAISGAVTGVINIITALWTAYISTITGIWKAVFSAADSVWKTITSVITAAVTNAINTITQIWNAAYSTLVGIWSATQNAASTLWNAINAVITGTINAISSAIVSVWNNIYSVIISIWNNISTAAGQVWNGMATLISGTINNTYQSVIGTWNTIYSGLVGVWNNITTTAGNVFNGLSNAIGATMTGIYNGITGTWTNISNTLSNTWTWIVNTTGTTMNGIIGAIKWPINEAIKMFNWFANNINKLGISFGGASTPLGDIPAFDLHPFNVPTIPMLAAGGVVTSATLAVIGEAGPEAVIPLSKLSQIMGDKPRGSGGPVTIHIYEATDPDKVQKSVVKELRRQGVIPS